MMPSPMTRVEKLDNQMAMINSPDALRKLRGYQSMMQPPIIQREMGGVADVMPEEKAAVIQEAQQGAEQGMQLAEQIPPEMQEQYAGDVAELKEAARGLAGMGRMGDTELVHMTADELSGLHSMGELTYNPVTGLPEAFSLGKIFKSITKPIKNIVKSKAFKTLAPIVLGIAAPYALAGMGAFGLSSVAAMSPLAFGATTALGTGLGSLLAGQKPGDALKSALISGVTAGTMRGIGNKMAGKPFMGGKVYPEATGVPGASNLGGTTSSYTPGGVSPSSSYTGGIASSPSTTSMAAGIPGVDSSNIGQAVYPGGGVSGGGIPVPGGADAYAASANLRPEQLQAAISPQPRVAPIIQKQPGFFDTVTSKDFYKDTFSAMKDDFIVPKDGGGISVLGTGKKVLGAVAPTQFGEMAADASAMERKMLTEEEFNLNPSYRESFPNYQAYTANYYKNLKPTQYADEASAVKRFVASGGGQPMETAAGGEFSGQVPGQGDGMEDNVFMPIKKGNEQIGTLAVSPSEYVVDSYTMAALGNGNTDEGAKIMDNAVKQIRKKAYGTTEQPNEIDGIRSLVPLTRSVV